LKRWAARASLLGLVLLVIYIFLPIRIVIPWKLNLVFPVGFEGPVRIVSAEKCEGLVTRRGLTYSVAVPPSGQVVMSEPIFDRATTRGQYAGAPDVLPSIRPDSKSTGFDELSVRVSNGRWVVLAFVGTDQDLAALGRASGVEAHFRDMPLPSCADERKLP
jgi:hypothetical protein